MMNIQQFSHNDKIEQLVDIICQKTNVKDRNFFRQVVIYYLARMASSLRISVVAKNFGEIHLNAYVIALASSGFGKGRSMNIIEKEFLKQFDQKFKGTIFSSVADDNITDYANRHYQNAIMPKGKNQTPQEYKEVLVGKFQAMGAYVPEYDEATAPALKQARQKIILAGLGSINLRVDEIGTNLNKSAEILGVLLELYDMGLIKPKLTKSTKDEQRDLVLEGITPTNALLIGTDSTLFDGDKTEQMFRNFLKTGYSRRSLFAFANPDNSLADIDPENWAKMAQKLYHDVVALNQSDKITHWDTYFGDLASPTKCNQKIIVPDEVGIEINLYQIQCEHTSKAMFDLVGIKKVEMKHRHFKALKVAGLIAFLEDSKEITIQMLHEAIKIVEESGDAFSRILAKDPDFVALAKVLGKIPKREAVTQADLQQLLPFFSGHPPARHDMLMSAIEYGSNHGILIHKEMFGKVEKYYSEPLEEIDLNAVTVSYSGHSAEKYNKLCKKFSDLSRFGTIPNQQNGESMYWSNHHFDGDHRREDNAIPGFNIVVLDVDGTAQRNYVHNVLSHYKFITHTTKRHTATTNRFRVIIPIRYTMKLRAEDYKHFMKTLYSYLPFTCDEATNHMAVRWSTHDNGDPFINEFEDDGTHKLLLDPLRFLASTEANQAHIRTLNQVGEKHPGALRRYFVIETYDGNRNKNMFKFGMALIDLKKNMQEIESEMTALNDSVKPPLPEVELRALIARIAKYKQQKGN